MSLLDNLSKRPGYDLCELTITMNNLGPDEPDNTANVYLPVRTVRNLIENHSVHPETQLIVAMKVPDSTRKRGFKEELVLFTRDQLIDGKIDIDLLIKHDKIYLDQQMVWIQGYSRYGNKQAEIFELQELTRKLKAELENATPAEPETISS